MFHLPKLPYAFSALEPKLSAATLQMHYEGHHQAYVNRLNTLLESDKRFEGRSLLGIMGIAEGELFNQAAQAWNHSFYWFCMTPQPGSSPDSSLELALRTQFRSLQGFRQEFIKKGSTLFGSGWLWLTLDKKGELLIELTQNAENPASAGRVPLLVCDLWEHSYYLDYQKNRTDYLEAFFELIDWKWVSTLYAAKAIPDMSSRMGSSSPD